MSVPIAQIVVVLLYAYLACGVIVSIWMHAGGLGRVDATAAKGTAGFRILITPGLVVLWPLILRRAIRGAGHPPAERNAHRDAADGGRV